MKNNYLDKIFKSTVSLKVLSFLAENTGKEYSGNEIQTATCISKSGVYSTLIILVKYELVVRIKKGSLFIFTINYDSPLVKQFKVLLNIIRLKPVFKSLIGLSKKIVLYGSLSRGEDYPISDIDLFIVSKDPETTKEKISKIKTSRKIQAVIKAPFEIPELKNKDKIFYEEVSRGITLWEEKE